MLVKPELLGRYQSQNLGAFIFSSGQLHPKETSNMAIENDLPILVRDTVPFDYNYFARLFKWSSNQNRQYSRVGFRTKVSTRLRLILTNIRIGVEQV